MNEIERQKIYNLGMNLININQAEAAFLCFKSLSEKYMLYDIVRFATNDYILPYIVRLHHVKLFTERWMLFNRDKIHNLELAQRNPKVLPFVQARVTPDYKQAIVEETESALTISEQCIFLGGDENYCHWINRYIMRLSLIEDYLNLQTLPLVVNAELSKFQKESLKLLNISDERLLKVPPNTMITFEDLIIPVCVRDTDLLPQACAWLRRKLEKYRFAPTGRRIYVSRGEIPGRILINEKEVLELLAKYHFEIINPGDYSFADQIRIFSEATAIVGPHGAGLVNLVFAPEKAFVVEFSNNVLERMIDFQEISEALSLRYTRLISQNLRFIAGKSMHDFHEYDVDLESLKKSLENGITS